MADDPLDQFHQAFMQDVLPVGIGMMEQMRVGGFNKVMEGFSSSSNPLEELRSQGEPAAKLFRDRLDQVSPGLGNPVMKVTVEVDQAIPTTDEMHDSESLMLVLDRIQTRLDTLENCLQQTSTEFSNSSTDQD